MLLISTQGFVNPLKLELNPSMQRQPAETFNWGF